MLKYTFTVPEYPVPKQSMRFAVLDGEQKKIPAKFNAGSFKKATGTGGGFGNMSAAAFRDLNNSGGAGAKKKPQVITYQTEEIKNWEKTIQAYAVQQLPRPIKRLAGAVFMEILYVFPFLKEHNLKIRGEVMDGVRTLYKTTKPDLTDNLNKPIADALQDLVYTNDSQVAKFAAEKIYGPAAKIVVTLSVLPN